MKLASLNWHPYIGKDLPSNGFVAQIVREAFLEVGVKVQIDFFPWARALQMVKSGKYDGLLPEYFDIQRLENFIYSAPFSSSPVGFYKRSKDNISFDGHYKKLKPYTIGLVRGYVNTSGLDSSEVLKKELVNTDLYNLKKLYAKRVDLIFIDKNVAAYTIRTQLKGYEHDLEFLEPPIENKKLYIAFSKNSKRAKKYLDLFNRGLKIIEKKIPSITKKFGI